MIKFIIRQLWFWSLFTGILSCQQTSNPAELSKENTAVDLKKSAANYELSVYEQMRLFLPEDIELDSMLKFDKARNLEIIVILPESKDEKTPNYDVQLKNIIKQYQIEFTALIDTLIEEDSTILIAVPSSFYVEPAFVYKDEKIVSYCLIVSRYRAGAAHPVTGYYSFNYDLLKQKRITFSDYFNVKTSTDTLFFINAINKAINIVSVGTQDLHDIDFNLEKDTISFNFDDYEIASYAVGIVEGRVSKKELLKFINVEYH